MEEKKTKKTSTNTLILMQSTRSWAQIAIWKKNGKERNYGCLDRQEKVDLVMDRSSFQIPNSRCRRVPNSARVLDVSALVEARNHSLSRDNWSITRTTTTTTMPQSTLLSGEMMEKNIFFPASLVHLAFSRLLSSPKHTIDKLAWKLNRVGKKPTTWPTNTPPWLFTSLHWRLSSLD